MEKQQVYVGGWINVTLDSNKYERENLPFLGFNHDNQILLRLGNDILRVNVIRDRSFLITVQGATYSKHYRFNVIDLNPSENQITTQLIAAYEGDEDFVNGINSI